MWLATLYNGLCNQLTRMETLAVQAHERGAALEEEFPQLYTQYRLLLAQQHHLYRLALQDMDALRTLQEEHFRQISLASQKLPRMWMGLWF